MQKKKIRRLDSDAITSSITTKCFTYKNSTHMVGYAVISFAFVSSFCANFVLLTGGTALFMHCLTVNLIIQWKILSLKTVMVLSGQLYEKNNFFSNKLNFSLENFPCKDLQEFSCWWCSLKRDYTVFGLA